MQVHADGGGDEELVGNGVLVGHQARVPEHAAAAEGGIPALGGQLPEDPRAVSKGGHPAAPIPCLGAGGRVRPGRGHAGKKPAVLVNEADGLEPAEDDPEHVVVGLVTEGEGVLAKVVGDDVGEVAGDDLLLAGGALGRLIRTGKVQLVRDGAQGGGDVSVHDGAGPVDALGPGAEPALEVGVLHVAKRHEHVVEHVRVGQGGSCIVAGGVLGL